MFMSPMVTNNEHQWHQSYTQCTGRACRPGQTRVVKIYKFVSMGTIDVDIYEERSGKTMWMDELNGYDPLDVPTGIALMDEKSILASKSFAGYSSREAAKEALKKATLGSGYRRADFDDELD